MRALLLLLSCLSAFAAPSVKLEWDANTEPDLAGYIIYYGLAPGTYTNQTDVGNVTNRTVTNLVAGATYYFVATAYNMSGLESDYSNEVSWTATATEVISVWVDGSEHADGPWTNIWSVAVTNAVGTGFWRLKTMRPGVVK